MMEIPKVIIIHGTGGHPDRNWFPWLKQEVIALGYRAAVPAFPTPSGQSLRTWQQSSQKEIGPVETRQAQGTTHSHAWREAY